MRELKLPRLFVGGVGVVLVGLGLLQSRETVAIASLILGVGLVLIAAFLPAIKKIDVSAKEGQLSLETRDEAAATAIRAEEPSPEQERAEAELALDEAEQGLADARWLVANAAIEQLLHPPSGPLAGSEFRLFLYDEERHRLLPALDPDRDPELSEGWAIGQGVTGEAWRREAYVIATGAECSDDTFGLNADQQERYRDLVVVAAAPVVNAKGRMLAVLSGSSRDVGSRVGTPEGFDAHVVLAAAVARILVDLLHWASDE